MILLRKQKKKVFVCWKPNKLSPPPPAPKMASCWLQGLYCDIRQLVQFIKEAHGNVFRRVALSALLDSAEKLIPGRKTEENTEQEPKPPGSKKYVSGLEKPLRCLNGVVRSALPSLVSLAFGEKMNHANTICSKNPPFPKDGLMLFINCR